MLLTVRFDLLILHIGIKVKEAGRVISHTHTTLSKDVYKRI